MLPSARGLAKFLCGFVRPIIRRVNWMALAILPVALFGNLLAQTVPASGVAWTAVNTGLPSTFFGITALTVDPSNASTLYAISAKGGLFKSTDGAASWKTAKGLAGLTFLAIDPTKSSTIYAAANGSIYKSTDGGASWSAANNLAPYCSRVVIDPVTPATVYGLCNSGILKTTDGGATWKQIYSSFAGSLVIDPTASSTIYASINNADIVKSTDGGDHWAVAKNGIPVNPFSTGGALIIDPVTPSTLYAGSFAASSVSQAPGVPPIDLGTGSISRSTDGGQTWAIVRAGIPSDAFVESLALNPASPSTIYAGYSRAGAGGILQSNDGGQNWTVVNTAGFADVTMATDPHSPATVYAAYSALGLTGSMAKSDDAGSTWQPVNAGLDYYDIRALAFDPASPTSVYAGGGFGLFKTVDAGGSWNKLDSFQVSSIYFPQGTEPAGVRSLLVDFKNPNTLYAETARADGCASDSKTLFKSTDRGATWIDSNSPPSSGCLLASLGNSAVMAMDPSDSQTLYLSENDDEDGYYALTKSSDGGASWNIIWSNWFGGDAPQSDVNAVAIDPVTTTTLYAGLSNGVFKSMNGGLSWSATALNNAGVAALAIDQTDPRIIYAGTTGGLLKSLDAGASRAAWGLVGVNLTLVVISPNDSKVIYAVSPGNGVYKSADGGQSWTEFDAGLTNLNVQALVAGPGMPTTLYAATPYGVFRIVDAPVVPEARWRRRSTR